MDPLPSREPAKKLWMTYICEYLEYFLIIENFERKEKERKKILNYLAKLLVYLLFCSKRKKKWLKVVWEYLKKKYETYEEWSDNALATNSDNLYDHHCRPTDPQAATIQSPWHKK